MKNLEKMIGELLAGANWPGATAHAVEKIPPRDERKEDAPLDLADKLGASAADRFSQLKMPKRRADFLAGKEAAKQAVRNLFTTLGRKPPSPREIEIVRGPAWEPLVRVPRDLRFELPIFVSLAHSHELAAAIAFIVPADAGFLGLDIEWTGAKLDPAFESVAFGAEELVFLDSLAKPDLRVEMAWKLWTAKEAALKSLRLGLTVDAREVITFPAPPRDFRVMYGSKMFYVRTGVSGPYAASVSVPAGHEATGPHEISSSR
jgi:phosphopantetheinyl transferase (holo-ACP synthase)